MVSTISDFFSSAPPTSQLHAPSEVQQPNDFDSTVTVTSTESDSLTIPENIDWSRLHGYTATPRLSKRPKSFVWLYGNRLKKDSNNQIYWLCRICHQQRPLPHKPNGHIYRCNSTTQAIIHLAEKHQINQDGKMTAYTPKKTPQTIAGFNALLQERNNAISTFNLATFKALLVRLFTVEHLSFVKVDSAAFRDLLVYLQPSLRGAIPCRTTLSTYVGVAYEKSLKVVENAVQTARTRVNLSFDLWTSPGRRLSLLGVVAHYLDAEYKPATVLLALPRLYGSHTGISIADQIRAILRHFRLEERFGHAIADNASENTTCLNHLSELLNIPLDKRRVMCMGHVINLVAQQCLFGSDVTAFEEELTNITAEELELQSWRKKGPIGKLHNLIRYILHSSKRRDLLHSIQQSQYHRQLGSHNEPLRIYDLIRDNLTRWNSWYDAAVRALMLRSAIDEFIDHELGEYHAAMARFSSSRSQSRKPPKTPSLLSDVLNADDWSIIAAYVALLKPLKDATMLLQGHVNTTAKGDRAVKGAIWQVLPIFESLMTTFEEARERHYPVETLANQCSQQQSTQSSAPSQPPTPPTSRPSRVTRSSQSIPITRSSAPINDPISQTEFLLADERMTDQCVTQTSGSDESIDSQKHFNTNINLGWQKLNYYFFQTDSTPIYRAAVVLHPRLKWRWFERYWHDKPQWRRDAVEAVTALWHEYKHTPIQSDTTTIASSPSIIHDEWSLPDDDQTNAPDQFTAYLAEPWAQVHPKQSPIPYWISKISVWPQLARMALDIYSTPACSDSPERVFSHAGDLLQPRRRTMTADHVEEILCLQDWQARGIVTLDTALFEQAIRQGDNDVTSSEYNVNNTTEGDDEVLYHEHEREQ